MVQHQSLLQDVPVPTSLEVYIENQELQDTRVSGEKDVGDEGAQDITVTTTVPGVLATARSFIIAEIANKFSRGVKTEKLSGRAKDNGIIAFRLDGKARVIATSKSEEDGSNTLVIVAFDLGHKYDSLYVTGEKVPDFYSSNRGSHDDSSPTNASNAQRNVRSGTNLLYIDTSSGELSPSPNHAHLDSPIRGATFIDSGTIFLSKNQASILLKAGQGRNAGYTHNPSCSASNVSNSVEPKKQSSTQSSHKPQAGWKW